LAEEREHPPFAPALVESMRAVGYSLEAAIADLIDNSLSAKAKNIRVRFSPYGEPYVAIVDDGVGMSRDGLVDAMRHGSRNPNELRASTDLGRFGLGLKTASLAHCRRLTVITMRDGVLAGAVWDLDVIARTERWTLLLLADEEIAALPHVSDIAAVGHGTIVFWHVLDRLGIGEGSIEDGMREGMVRVGDHLALVFHRFLQPDDPSQAKVAMSLNEDPLAARNPFLSDLRATLPMQPETIKVDGVSIHVQPYILPHFSKLNQTDLERAGGEEGLRRQQGFYVYRSRRLIVWGSWFRLAGHDELTKLARVRVDIPNSLDPLWTLDIKKSTASPPAVVAQNLRRIMGKIAQGSRRVYTYRGRKANDDTFVHLWDRIELQGGGIEYRINRQHPMVTAIQDGLDNSDRPLLEGLLSNVEKMLPAEALYADMASNPKAVVRSELVSEEELYDLAGRLKDACRDDGERLRLLQNLPILEPFVHYPEVTASIVARMQHG
jgi:hypothetical protein